jgi:hypothetical protein
MQSDRPSNWSLVVGCFPYLMAAGMIYALLALSCCSAPPNTPNANTILQLSGYSTALEQCRAEGKDAGSYDVYEQCAQKADAAWGRTGK